MTTTPVYDRLVDAVARTDRFVSSCGGTRSGKTFANLQLIYKLALADKRPTITSVVSETFPHLKRGAIRDFAEVLGNLFDTEAWSKGDSVYTLPNGSIIEFFSADSPAKVHGPARDRLFLNEVQNIPWEIARQLFVRTRGLVILDYNPTHEGWVQEQIESRQECVTIHSTYKDNSFLSPEQVREIEANQGDANWWRVYGLGLVGSLEGLIYPDFQLIDKLPENEDLTEVWGMDFGFSCFRGDTLITTSRGDVPIKDIQPGDMVLTRKGYRRVIEKKCNGVKQVVEKKLLTPLGERDFFCTFNHKFNINGKWKKYGELQKGDNLCMLSPTEAGSSKDTPAANIPTTTTTSGRRTGSIIWKSCTGLFGKILTGVKSRKDMTFTTKTGIHLITPRRICNWLQNPSIAKSTTPSPAPSQTEESPQTDTRPKIGRTAGPSQWSGWRRKSVSANNAVRSLRQQMCIKDSAQKSVTTNGNTPPRNSISNSFANAVGGSFSETNISGQNRVQRSARISYQSLVGVTTCGTEYCEVYDLWVEGVHEYFANGVLVHNCDPTAIVRMRADRGRKFLYIDEICYEKAMKNSDIAAELVKHDIPRGVNIWADAAEPKSIAEIGQQTGFKIKPCDKSAPTRSDRLKFQLQWMQGWKLFVTKSSLNWIHEARNYTWQKDRDGNLLNQPIDIFNHLMDATRYGAFSEFAGKNTGNYTIGFASRQRTYDTLHR